MPVMSTANRKVENIILVSGGTKDPRDAASSYLAHLPIDGIVLEDPGRWRYDNSKRCHALLPPPPPLWLKDLQHGTNSEGKTPENSPKVPSGGEGCKK